MKSIIHSIIFGFVLSACSLFEEEEEFPNCDQELLNKAEEQEVLRVSLRYDMPYTPEAELTEEESEAQREAIDEMHQKFSDKIEHIYGEEISNHSTLNSMPSSYLTVKPKGLEYICQLDMVSRVTETGSSTTN